MGCQAREKFENLIKMLTCLDIERMVLLMQKKTIKTSKKVDEYKDLPKEEFLKAIGMLKSDKKTRNWEKEFASINGMER